MFSQRALAIKESQIREASRYCDRYGALNLAQGLPDFAAPLALKEAAQRAIAADWNQYADPWGLAALRQGLAEKLQRDNGIAANPDTEITVCCGATEGLNLALMALVDPGDRVLIFEPFYENYVPNLATVGGVPVFFPLDTAPIDRERLAAVFAQGLKAVIVNTPSNPTGKVWSREELSWLAELCDRHNVYAITDEIYEHILYSGEHHSLLAWPEMRERTVLVNGFSKTFCVTGWRLGYTVACPALTAAMRRIHDFLTICAPAPLQHAAVVALAFGEEYFTELAHQYRTKRTLLLPALQKCGLNPVPPQGAYYIWADGRAIAADGAAAAEGLAREAGLAVVPGACFTRGDRSPYIRFCFAKKDETLLTAVDRLQEWQATRRPAA